MGAFVCTVGLTRRLVEADDATEALERFLAIVPRGAALAGARSDITVVEASEADVAAVGLRRRGFNVETMTLPIDLPPARARRKIKSTDHA